MNDSKHAQSVLDSAAAFRAQAEGVRAEPDRLRALAAAQYEAVRDSQVADQVRAMPVDRLRDAAPNLRLGRLKAAGYHTVADVQAAGLARLDAAPGIGHQSAVLVLRAARELVEALTRDTAVRLDPDRPERGHTQLLQLMSKLRRATQLVAPLHDPISDVLTRVDDDVRLAARATSRVRMLFSFKKNRQATLDALDRLRELLGSRDVVALRAVDTQLRVPDLDQRALWRDYELDAAAYNTVLADLAGLAGTEVLPDRSAARGFVPEDIEREVENTRLDTSLLTVSLRGYQAFGARFVLARKRVIIGDEMGLGKTIEAIAVMASLAADGRRGFLVVCPASVVVNWVNEIARHSGLVPHRLHGAGRDAAVGEWRKQGGVGVTTFGTLPKLELPRRLRPALVVVDEAHFVKNPDTQRSKAVNAVVQRAERALLLTGTPMENRVEEFRTLVSYLQPNIAARSGGNDALVGAKAFRRVVAPVYLRRNQEDVLGELPELLEVEDWVEFGPQDRQAYREAVRAGNLMAMRRAAYDPGTPEGSAKLERLLEIVEESRDNGWKVVVFSYFLDVLASVAEHVGPDAFGPLTGSTSAEARQTLVDDFTAREDHAVLVSQIEAGGVGLNIQAASVVIIAEPQWKPSTEEQAIARCHRMGQTRKVHVHRLLVKDSVDVQVQEIRDHKTLLFDEYARESDTKHAHKGALDTEVSVEKQVVLAEQQRLGL
ncbi:DEAD/DEAH box helicase [Umezawaea tangerina]|uniref:SNF2 family DNA or RNA helicase n=1 Tax=Umezawaea tangerina TaxID=84725 RepID=A0A2T0SSK4_9PSEU|nr:SNF2-related protein [Umezawaea tangerina]PRY36389.1 SNF2 family DNA or RNA helicase [Umezawaea tangerina]